MSNCNQCGAQINSPKLTGELCTFCYFKRKHEGSNPSINQTALIERPVETISLENNRFKDVDISPSALEERLVEDTKPTEVINHVEDTEISRDLEQRVELEKEKLPSVSKDSNGGIKGKKYCQSCIERGYGLVLATREFRQGEFICDDCFVPMLENTLGYQVARAEIERVKVLTDDSLPLLEQFYDLLEIPTELRFVKSENVLSNRNQIFNYHAKALVNQDLKDIVNNIEQLQVMLFQIKIGLEPLTDYINRVKADEREKANLESIKKGKSEAGKVKGSSSKIKNDKEQKMANVMFPFIKDEAERLKKYREMAAKAREAQFDKTVGN